MRNDENTVNGLNMANVVATMERVDLETTRLMRLAFAEKLVVRYPTFSNTFEVDGVKIVSALVVWSDVLVSSCSSKFELETLPFKPLHGRHLVCSPGLIRPGFLI